MAGTDTKISTGFSEPHPGSVVRDANTRQVDPETQRTQAAVVHAVQGKCACTPQLLIVYKAAFEWSQKVEMNIQSRCKLVAIFVWNCAVSRGLNFGFPRLCDTGQYQPILAKTVFSLGVMCYWLANNNLSEFGSKSLFRSSNPTHACTAELVEHQKEPRIMKIGPVLALRPQKQDCQEDFLDNVLDTNAEKGTTKWNVARQSGGVKLTNWTMETTTVWIRNLFIQLVR
ncbi:hypothetical protein DFH07DRAFT_764775 [Mycena maculata]|uniref:Uncharacterized protein n=1 Tax=Mycena maculata TaxID=230809 RepID=A0AAD7NZS1_9AGAR|nr:hypothetical protein DFH07DRAFT_764775 [Mycena maculata]